MLSSFISASFRFDLIKSLGFNSLGRPGGLFSGPVS
jgi:hypothetical protein